MCRHILFWLLAYVFYLLLHISTFLPDIDFHNTSTLHDTTSNLVINNFYERLKEVGNSLIIIVVYSYLITYWLIPQYLYEKKYKAFGALLVIFTLMGELWRLYLFGLKLDTPIDNALFILWMDGLSFVNVGPPIFFGLFITIKMLKTLHLKQDEKLILIRENKNAELELLKAQVHPHFLFNTLNNIYSFALNQSPQAPVLVQKLSDMLKYMIHECDVSLVSLEKELKMIEDYVGLEKVRYGNRLDIEVTKIGDPRSKFIAPLLMIPFIENSFKHGASRMLGNPWIKLYIRISDQQLFFHLSNSKPVSELTTNGKHGLGLKNVKRRLELLYPAAHHLEIKDEEKVFSVEMNFALEEEQIPALASH